MEFTDGTPDQYVGRLLSFSSTKSSFCESAQITTDCPSPLQAEQSNENAVQSNENAEHPRKRRKRNRKPRNVDKPTEAVDERKEEKADISVTPAVHRPFQRIVFNDDGNVCEVVSRSKTSQINRRHQKRLATSSYDWSSANTIQPKADISEGSLLAISEVARALAQPVKVAKNLEVRIHAFPVVALPISMTL